MVLKLKDISQFPGQGRVVQTQIPRLKSVIELKGFNGKLCVISYLLFFCNKKKDEKHGCKREEIYFIYRRT